MLVVPIVACATFDFASYKTVMALAFLIAGAAGTLLRMVGSGQAAKSDSPRSIRPPTLPT